MPIGRPTEFWGFDHSDSIKIVLRWPSFTLPIATSFRRRSRMKHILMALTGVLVAGALPTHAAAVSNFNVNDEGWRSVTLGFPDPRTPPAILQTFLPNWLPAGGNPGGYIFNNDPNGNVQYWLAPASFLGNQSAAYSNSLLFSLMDSPVGAGFDQAD